MKRIFSIALIVALTIGVAQAQTTIPDTHQGPKQEHKMAFDKLNLSADQKARLKSIREDFKKGMADLKNDSKLSAEDVKTRRIELHQKYESNFESILTPAQKEQWTQLKQQRKEDRQRTGQFKMRSDKDSTGHAFRGGKKFGEALGLTADQQQKLSSIRADFKPKYEALRKDSTLAADQKKAKMHELRKQQQEQMKTVLTAEQIQKMKSLRKEHSATNV